MSSGMESIRARLLNAWKWLTTSNMGQRLLTLLALLALSLVAIQPSTFGSMPATDDGLLHLYRLIGLHHAASDGGLWPRYVAGMAYGYGVPVFNYYSPLSLYPALILRVIGFSYVHALLISMCGATLLAAVGAYRLGRAWGNRLSGFATAAAFIYAPYLIINWPRRGAVAEYMALALMPWALWAFHGLSRRGRPFDLGLASLLFAAVIVMHNITALVAAVILIPYCLLLWWTAPDAPMAFLRLLLAGIFGVGLSAFYWAPALMETGYVHIERVTGATGTLDYADHFLTLWQVFAAPPTADLTQLNSPVPRALPWPQMLIGVAGGLWAISRRLDAGARHTLPLQEGERAAWHYAAFALPLLAFSIFMMTRLSEPLWEAIPLLPYFQFPWRWLGPASLILAPLAGLGVSQAATLLPESRWRWGFAGVVLALLIAYALPWLYGQYLPDVPASGILDAQNFERETRRIGGTAEGEYVPRWSQQMPAPEKLIGLYAQGNIIPRLQPNADIQLRSARWGNLRADLQFYSDGPTTLVFDWLYFPGWWVELNGQRIAPGITQPEGLIRVDTAGGETRLRLGFGPTPLRQATSIGSLFALGLMAALMMARIPLWRAASDGRPGHPAEAPGLPRVSLALLALGVGVALLIFKLGVTDPFDTPVKRARFAQGLDAGLQTPVLTTMEDKIRLMGYDLLSPQVVSGQPVEAAIYWDLATGLIEEDLSSVLIVRDAEGIIVGQTLNFYPANLPTSTWVPGFYVREEISVALPKALAPGTYTLEAAIYDSTHRRNLDVRDSAGNPIGVFAPLGSFEVTRPRRPFPPESLDLSNRMNEALTSRLTLIDASGPPSEATVGDPIGMFWHWYAVAAPVNDTQARILWLDSTGAVAGQSAAAPLSTGYPTSLWQAQDVWRGTHLFYVPGRLSAGLYTLAVQAADTSGQPTGEIAPFGQMQVNVPARSFDFPRIGARDGAQWANGITLVGHTLPARSVAPADGLDLTLFWSSEQDLTRNLTIFLHLVDANGQIAAQQDQIPVLGSRPTPGWAPGEYLTDPYALFIPADTPPGSYSLRIGWYDALTGERLPLAEGVEFYTLPGVIQVGG